MKKVLVKFLKITGEISAFFFAGFGALMIFAWPFFRFMIYAGKKKKNRGNKNKIQWFNLRHTQVNHPRYKHLAEYEKTKKWCEAQPAEDWYIRSRDGLMLHATFLAAEDPKRFVVLCHGYRGSRFGSIAHMAQHMLESGSNLLIIDMRCCGESEGRYITFGAKEKNDVAEWLSKVNNVNYSRLPVYLYGQSMGATTVLLASGEKLPVEVSGIIADCGFHNMKQQLRDIASNWFHLHWIEILLFSVDILCFILAGFTMKETDVTEPLKNNTIPVLFFHGKKDTYVFPENTRINYDLCNSEKEVIYIPNARHLCSSYTAPTLYKKKLDEFFARYDED